MDLPEQKLKLRITERALKTAQTFARLIHEHVGPYEGIGFLAGEAGTDVIDTVILAPGQRVTRTSVVIDGCSVLAAGREIERLGKQAKGWWHSHGRLSIFHSGVDDANTQDVLAQIAPSNSICCLEYELFLQGMDGNGAVLFSDGHEVIEISVGDSETAKKLVHAPPSIRRKVPIGMAYSLVVNSREEKPYAELHTRRWCPTCQTAHVEQYTVPVEVIPTLNEAELVKEVEAKVSPVNSTFTGDQKISPRGACSSPSQRPPGIAAYPLSLRRFTGVLCALPREIVGFLSKHQKVARW